ncbi:hypothetical protein LP420_21940 [Massilia sp. B-10]|nr:hypothetical protein LP420_21940 [Massilia sp. B-10]
MGRADAGAVQARRAPASQVCGAVDGRPRLRGRARRRGDLHRDRHHQRRALRGRSQAVVAAGAVRKPGALRAPRGRLHRRHPDLAGQYLRSPGRPQQAEHPGALHAAAGR